MSALSNHVLAPIFRHFIPRSEDLVIHTPGSQSVEFFYISLKHLLIQGANPIDSNLISRADSTLSPQFQGGYRCFPEILSDPSHGVVQLSGNRLGFEYRPEMGYRGGDSFSYRLRNVMGQESNVSCVSLFVRV